MSLHSTATGGLLHETKRHKQDVRCASATSITMATPGVSVDSVAMSNGDRILLYSQTLPAENGIYIWHGAATALTRSTDATSSSDFYAGMLVYVREGAINRGKTFILTTGGTISLGTTSLSFQSLATIGPKGPLGPSGPAGPVGPKGAVGPDARTFDFPYIKLEYQNAEGHFPELGSDPSTGSTLAGLNFNTIVADTNNLVTLSQSVTSATITLPSGQYRVDAKIRERGSDAFQGRLQNITRPALLVLGTTGRCSSSDTTQSISHVVGRFTLFSTTTVQLQVQRASLTTGPADVSFGSNYWVINTVEFWRVADPPPFTMQVTALPPRTRARRVAQERYTANTLLPV